MCGVFFPQDPKTVALNPRKENAASLNTIRRPESQRVSHISIYYKYCETSLDNFVSFERGFKFPYFDTLNITLVRGDFSPAAWIHL